VAATGPIRVAPYLSIWPRSSWADGRYPKGPLSVEKPWNVKILLVHHTVGSNSYTKAAVPGIIRGIYEYHTGPKGWPDVAYNFLVDRFGRVWEGRKGSIREPVMGDATGGSQGFDQKCVFIGDHRTVPPTDAAMGKMVRLLAWLATRYTIDPSPGEKVAFVSRGSNKWPKGTRVTARTISGHRELSYTECPGDAVFSRIPGIQADVAAIVEG
jgi:hypothetical protein